MLWYFTSIIDMFLKDEPKVIQEETKIDDDFAPSPKPQKWYPEVEELEKYDHSLNTNPNKNDPLY